MLVHGIYQGNKHDYLYILSVFYEGDRENVLLMQASVVMFYVSPQIPMVEQFVSGWEEEIGRTYV